MDFNATSVLSLLPYLLLFSLQETKELQCVENFHVLPINVMHGCQLYGAGKTSL